MSGGPGCSGQVAMLGENGPYHVQEDLSLKLNPNSWNSNATVLWIDQPAGSGFSYGSYITNEDEMASDMYEFLGAFMDKYKAAGRDYTKLDFHIVGESYAGHYVPALSAKIVRENAASNATRTINYVGSAIGNGLTDPQVQFAHYATYLETYNPACYQGQCVKPAAIELMKAIDPICTGLTAGCNNATLNSTFQYTDCLMAYARRRSAEHLIATKALCLHSCGLDSHLTLSALRSYDRSRAPTAN